MAFSFYVKIKKCFANTFFNVYLQNKQTKKDMGNSNLHQDLIHPDNALKIKAFQKTAILYIENVIFCSNGSFFIFTLKSKTIDIFMFNSWN